MNENEVSAYANISVPSLINLYANAWYSGGANNTITNEIEEELFRRGYYLRYTPQGKWQARKS